MPDGEDRRDGGDNGLLAEVGIDELGADTRGRLLAAAIEAFGARGYDGASVRGIERAAGVNRGLVAYHFGSKEELWRASVEWLMERYHDEFVPYRQMLRMLEPHERRRILFIVFTRFCVAHPEYLRLLLTEGGTHGPRTTWLVEEHLRPTIDFFRRVVEGEVAGETREAAAVFNFAFTGAVSLVFSIPALCQELFGVDPTDEAVAERFIPVGAKIGLAVQEIVSEAFGRD